MIGTPRSGPARTEVVDYGYRAMAERRERLLAASSPAVRARILGKPPIVDPESSGLLGEIRELRRKHESLAAEVAELRQEQRRLAPSHGDCSIADVAKRFVAELARVGYRIEGNPVTVGDLQSAHRGAAWVRPRMAAIFLCSSIAREGSMPKVGRFFARDHTTVVYARSQIRRVLKQAPPLRIAALATCAALGAEPPAALHGKP
jgi:Bacterial dnaA protein helix-turn-helix